MRIALDATYSLGESLSGVGVYSRELLYGLSATGFAERWDWFYRSHRYWRARRLSVPGNVTRQLLADSWGNRAADLFHGLNQRLPKRRFRKQVSTFHDLFVLSGDYSTTEFRQRFAAQARDAAAASDLIIAVSAFTAGQIEHLLHVSPARIRVVHHGLTPRNIPDLPRENIVLCVGAVQRRKNQAALVRAFRALPPDWRLVLAGSQGFEADETLREVEKSPCAGRIHLTGYVSESDIAAWYARAAIFAFPSLDEGFGMPVIEAMAAGVPVVTSNGSALPEIVGDAGLLIDPRHDDELADALSQLAGDVELRQRLQAVGKAHAAKFTWARAVDRTIDVYRELDP